jgi:hypothetical protein
MVKKDLNEFVLEQEGARCHGMIYKKKFMEGNGIEVLSLVSHSLDMSIIENFWSYMKD